MANNAFGIDLGTNNIKIYNRNDDNIMIEKNMIAIENKNTLFAYGNSAFEMYEKAPSNIHIFLSAFQWCDRGYQKYGDAGKVFYR
ncbi:rod shape-determining protein [Waltera sp.]|uniref:rod shape-determining protein n=1 Tax=Waltera sp. TaxID=2815806 RepID=UPI00399F801F